MIHDHISQLESTPFSIRMLYATKVGSTLYGTATPSSDIDYSGIFLPSHPHHPYFQGKAKHTQPQSISLSTGDDSSANSADDIDQSYHSAEAWFKALAQGEATSIDLLFSMWNPEHIVKEDTVFTSWCRDNYLKLITSNPKAFIGFATGQARRYGVKGQRYRELVEFTNEVTNILSTYDTIEDSRARISSILEHIEASHIKWTEADTPRGMDGTWMYLDVLGKLYAPTIKISELLTHLTSMETSYGDRVKRTDDGIDWKALSHAVRATIEIKELLSTTRIIFPLAQAPLILSIKQGQVPLDEVITILETNITDVDALLSTTTLQAATDSSLYGSFLEYLYTKDNT